MKTHSAGVVEEDINLIGVVFSIIALNLIRLQPISHTQLIGNIFR